MGLVSGASPPMSVSAIGHQWYLSLFTALPQISVVRRWVLADIAELVAREKCASINLI